MKEKIISISLMLLFLLPVIGSYGWLRFRKASVRQEIKKHLEKGFQEEDLVMLAFDTGAAKTKLRWEHPGEFEFNGMMYDVVEKSIRGDSLFLLCWCDHKETRINKELAGLNDRVLDRKNRQHENRNLPSPRLIQPLYLTRQTSLHTIDYRDSGEPVLYYSPDCSTSTPEPPTPPPRSSDRLIS